MRSLVSKVAHDVRDAVIGFRDRRTDEQNESAAGAGGRTTGVAMGNLDEGRGGDRGCGDASPPHGGTDRRCRHPGSTGPLVCIPSFEVTRQVVEAFRVEI